MRTYLMLAIPVMLAGCGLSGNFDYVRPTITPDPSSHTIVIDRPIDEVWSATVPELGKRFFVINNIDRSSGLINLSYSGDPERYIDCGRMYSEVTNLRGPRSYEIPGAEADSVYELAENGRLFLVHTKMTLEGRVNLIFEALSAEETRVSANTRYVVRRDVTARDAAATFPQSASHTMSFTSDQGGMFTSGRPIRCVPTGALEREILSAVR